MATGSIKKGKEGEITYCKSGRTEQSLFMLTDKSLQTLCSESVMATLTPDFYLWETPRLLSLQEFLLDPITCHAWKRDHTQIVLSHKVTYL